MIVYLILCILNIIFAILFATNKYFVSDYKNNPCPEAKKIYRLAGIVETIGFAVGFLFMDFYDLSVNIDNEKTLLEGLGLFILFLSILGFIYFVVLYHKKMVEFKKETCKNEEELKNIKEYSQNLEKKEE